MKLVSYKSGDETRAGLVIKQAVFDLHENGRAIDIDIPSSMLSLLQLEEVGMERTREVYEAIIKGKTSISTLDAELTAPLPDPVSCRDAYAFRQHVATARQNRGADMIPEFDEFPVFYFTNHRAIFGPGEIMVEQDHLYQLDFELEIAAVIGKKGKNISSDRADDYIAGFTIMNDFSARRLQMEEMKLNLGPAKGKDFATAIGPWLVTPDELIDKLESSSLGNQYNLKMTAVHNDRLISQGNVKDMSWTFAEIIERVSYGAEIFPGDIIGSGTVGTGCYLELNGTQARAAAQDGLTFEPTWLQHGDVIELEIDQLGTLTNSVALNPESTSILAKKKVSHLS